MIGDPVGHTALPGAVARWAADQGVDTTMTPLHVAADAFAAVVSAIRGMQNCDGAVVTAPHKQAALELCDEVSEPAKVAGAVNVILRSADGRLSGDNTDGAGMARALQDVGFEPAGRRVLIFGCGGAGSAIALALRSGDLELTDTSLDRAAALGYRVGGQPVSAPADLGDYDLIVNATDVGLDGRSMVHDLSGLRSGAVVADVLATETAMIRQAQSIGAATVSGRAMAEAQLPVILKAFGWQSKL